MTYQGWTNKATWNVALWVNNDEQFHKTMLSHRPFTAEKAELFCSAIFGTKTPDGESLSDVDWQEIADDFNND